MKIEKIFAVCLIVISIFLFVINRNIGVFFMINTFVLYAWCVYLTVFIVSILKKNEMKPILLTLLIVYLFWGMPSIVKFYMDLPDYFSGNYEVIEGEIISSTSRRAYYDVRIADMEIPFWGLFIGYKDFPEGSHMRINYLKRSGIGLDFEMID